MNKYFKIVLSALVLTAAVFADGAAVMADTPLVDEDGYYLVSNADQLDWVAERFNSGFEASNMLVKLTEDIVYNETINTSDKQSNRKWTPIGDSTGSFYGVMDGQGHTIKGLYCSNAKCAGLISYNHGTIKNLGITDSYFYSSKKDGKAYTGSIAALHKEGLIENCFCVNTYLFSVSVTGGISGTIGSDPGDVAEIAQMKNCYIANCQYVNSVGATNMDAIAYPMSGNASVENCYWGLSTGRGLKSGYSDPFAENESSVSMLTTGELCYKLNGSVNPPENSPARWRQNINIDGVENDPYPIQNTSHYQVYCDDGIYTNHTYDQSIYNPGYSEENLGDVAMNAEGYYEIYNDNQLFQFADIVNQYPDKKNANAKLMRDITIYYEKIENEGNYRPWIPIGNINAPYFGEFDGQGFVISGIYGASYDYELQNSGLFGCIKEGADVKNLGIINSYIYAGIDGPTDPSRAYAGAVVAMSKGGSVTNCFSRDNTIISEAYAGGIIGLDMGNTKMKDCFCVRSSVNGNENYSIGAVVSEMGQGTTAENCFYFRVAGNKNKEYKSIPLLAHGDVDLNGTVDIIDAVSAAYLTDYVNENMLSYYTADFDESGYIDLRDMALIMRFASGMETE